MHAMTPCTPQRPRKNAAILLWLGLIVVMALSLGRGHATWAQPHQNGLRHTINTPVPTPTGGPTSTGTPTAGPCVQRVLLQQGLNGYAGTDDTWINAYTPDFPQSNAAGLKIKGGEIQSVLVRFDLTGVLPPGAHVVAAELVFYVEAFQETRSLDIAAFRVLRPWDKTTATWRSAAQGVRWGADGCNAVGQDRVADPDDMITLTHRAVFRGLDVTQSVRYWVQHPEENYGWLIKGVSASTAAYSFDSSTSQFPNRRPILRIDYDICGQTPEGTATATPTATPELTTTVTLTPSPTSATPSPTPQPTRMVLVADQDTYINQWEPTQNYGGTAELRCYSNGIQKPLVKFDLSGLPQYARVISATLHLRTSTTAPATGANITAHLLRRPWQESSATWERATSDVPWAMPGASSPTVDYDPTVLASQWVNAANREYVWDVSAAARQWVEEGVPNAGLLLIGQPGANVGYSFLSSEAKEVDYRPRLVLAYYIAPPTATPTITPSPTVTPTPTAARGNIVGLVYHDLNRDGVRQPGEPGIPGVPVELLTLARQVLQRVLTVADGSFSFTELAPGTYIVRQHNLWGYRSSTDSDVVTTVAGGDTVITFGAYQAGAVALPLVFKP